MTVIYRPAQKKRPWLVRVRDANRAWLPSKSFATRREAESYERELLLRRDRGEKAPIKLGLSMNAYWLLWRDECRGNSSEGWKKVQDQYFLKHVSPRLGDRPIDAIRPTEISSAIEAAPKGLHMHVYVLLRKMYGDLAERYGFQIQSPVLRSMRPKKIVRERPHLTPEQATILLEHTRELWVGPAVWLQILAGLRVGEVQALEWRDVGPTSIAIRRAYRNHEDRVADTTKGRKERRVPMTPDLAEYLAARRGADDELVAKGYDGEGRLSYEGYRSGLKVACRDAGVPNVGTHGLRHSTAEIWHRHGANLEDLRRLLGHRDTATTMCYVHETEQRLVAIAGRIGSHFGSQAPVRLRVIDGKSSK